VRRPGGRQAGASPGSSPRARAARWLRGSSAYPSLSSPRYPAQPSVNTRAPKATWSLTKACRQPAEASATGAIRTRPNPRGSMTSTAIAVKTFLPLPARPPRSPGSCQPMKVSSTSTVPDSSSRSGRTRTARSRCSIAQAVWYETFSSVRCRLRAETPSLLVANSQQALNHTVSGVRVRSKHRARRHKSTSTTRRAHEPTITQAPASIGPEPGLDLPPWTSDSARQHAEHPPTQVTPVKRIDQTLVTATARSRC
jgi:hypothetical protein